MSKTERAIKIKGSVTTNWLNNFLYKKEKKQVMNSDTKENLVIYLKTEKEIHKLCNQDDDNNHDYDDDYNEKIKSSAIKILVAIKTVTKITLIAF